MPVRRTLVIAATLFPGISLAGVPKDQLVPADKYKGVVRIHASFVSTQVGTGSVIGSYVKDGKGVLCILTADHVIATNSKSTASPLPDIDIFTGNDGDAGVVRKSAKVIARQGKNALHQGTSKWDLALLRVDWGKVDDTFTMLADNKFEVEAYNPSHKAFSSAGFGRTGELFTHEGKEIGYEHKFSNAAHREGKKRFWNNSVALQQADDKTADTYNNKNVRWYLEKTKPEDKTGHGSDLIADSGAPMLFESDGTKISDIAVRTKKIRGVVNQQYYTDAFGEGLSHFLLQWNGVDGGAGVMITPEYKGWIDKYCMTIVPEPSSFVAFAAALGFVGLSRLRHKPRLR